jgi:hypothetical protein
MSIFKVTLALFVLSMMPAHPAPLPQPKGSGQCPSGYAQSGGYCVPMSGERRQAVPKIGQCPSGWYQSGGYCKEIERSQ